MKLFADLTPHMRVFLLQITRNYLLRQRVRKFHYACRNGYTDAINSTLLNHPELIDMHDHKNGLQSMYHAAIFGSQLETLVRFKPSSQLIIQRVYGLNLIQFAVSVNADISVLEYLVNTASREVFSPSSPLSIAPPPRNVEILSGWLDKECAGRKVVRRWVVVTHAGVQYFSSPDDKVVGDFFPLGGNYATISTTAAKQGGFALTIDLSGVNSFVKTRNSISFIISDVDMLMKWDQALRMGVRYESLASTPTPSIIRSEIKDVIMSMVTKDGETMLHLLANWWKANCGFHELDLDNAAFVATWLIDNGCNHLLGTVEGKTFLDLVKTSTNAALHARLQNILPVESFWLCSWIHPRQHSFPSIAIC